MKNIDPQDARQGRNGKQVLIVLIISLIIVGIIWIGIEVFGPAPPKDENSLNNDNLSPRGSSTAPNQPESTNPAIPVSPAPINKLGY